MQRCQITDVDFACDSIERPVEDVEDGKSEGESNPGVAVNGQDALLDGTVVPPLVVGLAASQLLGGQGLVGDVAQGHIFWKRNQDWFVSPTIFYLWVRIAYCYLPKRAAKTMTKHAPR